MAIKCMLSAKLQVYLVKLAYARHRFISFEFYTNRSWSEMDINLVVCHLETPLFITWITLTDFRGVRTQNAFQFIDQVPVCYTKLVHLACSVWFFLRLGVKSLTLGYPAFRSFKNYAIVFEKVRTCHFLLNKGNT